MTNTDRLVLEGVFSQGYGMIPKAVMRDRDLSIEAKAIYGYLASYAGAGNTAFPSVSLMLGDLGIGKNRFYNHRDQLIEKGYLTISEQKEKGRFSKNVYILNNTPRPQNRDTGDSDTVNEDTGGSDTDTSTTNNNSLNNNIFNNNKINKDNNDNGAELENPNPEKSKPQNQEPEPLSNKSVHQFYQENFGLESPYIAQELEYWIEDLNVELVLEALKRAVEYGGEFGYAKRIMKNWLNKGIDDMEKVKQADVAFENKNKKKYNNRSNKPKREEKLPEWGKEEPQQADEPKDELVSEDEQHDFSSRLERLRKMREEKRAN